MFCYKFFLGDVFGSIASNGLSFYFYYFIFKTVVIIDIFFCFMIRFEIFKFYFNSKGDICHIQAEDGILILYCHHNTFFHNPILFIVNTFFGDTPLDRRLFTRIEIPGAVIQYKKPGVKKMLSGLSKPREIKNISKSGLSFLLDKKFSPGEHIAMKVQFPDGNNFNLKGQVRWNNTVNSDNSYEIGIQFSPYGTAANYNPLSALDYLRNMEGQEVTKISSE